MDRRNSLYLTRTMDLSIGQNIMNGDAISLLLETFQELRRRGDQARLFLETRNGDQFGNLQIKIPRSKPGAPNTSTKIKPKSPSTIRRDRQRMESFLERKTRQESLRSPSASSTPISRPGPTRSSEEVRVTMPVTEALNDGVEHQVIQTEKEEDKDRVDLNLERIGNTKKTMTNEELENYIISILKAGW